MKPLIRYSKHLDHALIILACLCMAFLLILPWGGVSFGGLSVHRAYSPAGLVLLFAVIRIIWKVLTRQFNFVLILSTFTASLIAVSFIFWQLYRDNSAPVVKMVRAVANPSSPTRIILITCDTLRADHLGCYGYAKDTSPNIDRLARQSVVFMNHYVQVPVTGPSHACILTGRYPWEHRVICNATPLPPEEYTLAEVFRDNGYRTVGWIACEILLAQQGFNQGFDEFHDDLVGEPLPPENRADRQTDRAIEFFKNIRKDEKVFAWIHYFDPHAPYRAPGEQNRYFLQPPDRQVDTGQERLASIYHDNILLATSEVEDIVAVYNGEVRFMDAEIGRFLDYLRDSGLMEDSLIVLTSDHGEELYQHDFFIEHNQSLYEGVLRSPLIVYSPEISRLPGIRNEITESVDIFPMILSLAGIKGAQQSRHSGVDLSASIWRNRNIIPPRPLFAQLELTTFFQPAYALRKEDWKLIYHTDGRRRLYDLASDPGERKNLANQEKEIKRQLKAELNSVLAETIAAMKPSNPATFSPETLRALKSLGYLD